MINVKNIIIKGLEELGAVGLCNPAEECGCDIDDLAPCDCVNVEECVPAKLDEGLLSPIEVDRRCLRNKDP